MTLYLYTKHNYYNRKIKRFETINEYSTWLNESPVIVQDYDFKPNDNVVTEIIVNYDVVQYPEFATGYESPSYCLLVEESTILNRWWVTNSVRLRNGQARVSLLRDLISDYYNEVITGPSFISKGFVSSINDTAIFNNENMTFNQIKTSETFIQDKTKAAWYIAYISKDLTTKNITIPGKNINVTDIYDTADEYPYSKWTAETPFIADYSDVTYQIYAYTKVKAGLVNVNTSICAGWDDLGKAKTPPVTSDWKDYSQYLGTGFTAKTGATQGFKLNADQSPDSIFTAASNVGDWRAGSYALTEAHNSTATDTFLAEQGRFIRVGGEVYKVNVVELTSGSSVTKEIPNANAYANKFRTVAQNAAALDASASTIEGTFCAITYTSPTYYINLQPVDESGLTFTIPATRQHTSGVPYDILAIPATAVWLDDDSGKSINWGLSEALVNAINTDLVGGQGAELYDLQLLPYCPILDDYIGSLPGGQGKILTSKMKNDDTLTQYTKIAVSGTNDKTIVIYAESAEFEKVLTDSRISVPSTVEDFKVANECDLYRLCSPNYNGQFEFSVTKNGGVSSWRIAFNYKPYTPYIRVAPSFGRLYGKNFDDARGLILGGDFSLAQTNDAWLSYELQNKNYQVMFDRQITNMEFNNRMSKTSDIINAITGTVSAASTGGISGSMIGGALGSSGTGAAVGAAVAGVTSAVGGTADVILNDKIRREQLDYTKDQYGYQLGNIKAMPYSLTKVSSQNADFKYWPFVEKYTCTEVEKSALRSKLNWNGMTIMRVGRIQDFLKETADDIGTFIQAKPLRLDDVATFENSRVIDALAAELQTGVYII